MIEKYFALGLLLLVSLSASAQTGHGITSPGILGNEGLCHGTAAGPGAGICDTGFYSWDEFAILTTALTPTGTQKGQVTSAIFTDQDPRVDMNGHFFIFVDYAHIGLLSLLITYDAPLPSNELVSVPPRPDPVVIRSPLKVTPEQADALCKLGAEIGSNGVTTPDKPSGDPSLSTSVDTLVFPSQGDAIYSNVNNPLPSGSLGPKALSGPNGGPGASGAAIGATVGVFSAYGTCLQNYQQNLRDGVVVP
jgi:hypothetical protein